MISAYTIMAAHIVQKEHRAHRGRRSKDKAQLVQDIYRELTSTAFMIIERTRMCHRLFCPEDEYPEHSWLLQYADHPQLMSVLKKLATRKKSFNSMTISDVQEFYENLTHEDFRLRLLQYEHHDIEVEISTDTDILFSSLDQVKVEKKFSLRPVTLESLSELPLEDRIIRVLPPLRFSVKLRTELHAALNPPEQLCAYTNEHHALKQRAFSIVLYAPSGSGLDRENLNLPAPYMHTREFDNWDCSYPICVTNFHSLLGVGIYNIAIIPDLRTFRDRCFKQKLGCDELYHQWYQDVLDSARHADKIFYTNQHAMDIQDIIPIPSVTRRTLLCGEMTAFDVGEGAEHCGRVTGFECGENTGQRPCSPDYSPYEGCSAYQPV